MVKLGQDGGNLVHVLLVHTAAITVFVETTKTAVSNVLNNSSIVKC